MKDIPVARGRSLIASWVAEGEHDHQDFKFLISDARKIARSVSAFSNAGGGRLLIGVKDNGVIAGVRNEEDIFVIEQAATLYCVPQVDIDFKAYRVDHEKVVIVATIPQAPQRPVRCKDLDGKLRAYYRVADENIAAHRLMVRVWTSSRPLHIKLDSTTDTLMNILRDAGSEGISTNDLPPLLGLSARRTDNLIVNLTRAGIVQFKYTAPQFMVCPV